MVFPKRHHRKICSTNVLERFNKEVKHCTKVTRAFPCDESVLRLLVLLRLRLMPSSWIKKHLVRKSGTRGKCC
ncbi:transposase [Nitrosophilus labii]|uniref:transposase n=1 Tax=Nitrosophilus labii TaxID=2706014 RepID=UPI0018D8CE4D